MQSAATYVNVQIAADTLKEAYLASIHPFTPDDEPGYDQFQKALNYIRDFGTEIVGEEVARVLGEIALMAEFSTDPALRQIEIEENTLAAAAAISLIAADYIEEDDFERAWKALRESDVFGKEFLEEGLVFRLFDCLLLLPMNLLKRQINSKLDIC